MIIQLSTKFLSPREAFVEWFHWNASLPFDAEVRRTFIFTNALEVACGDVSLTEEIILCGRGKIHRCNG